MASSLLSAREQVVPGLPSQGAEGMRESCRVTGDRIPFLVTLTASSAGAKPSDIQTALADGAA